MVILSGVGYLKPAETSHLKATVSASVQGLDPDSTSSTFKDSCSPGPDAAVRFSFAYHFFALSSTTAVTYKSHV
jgi:hypothetical protein